MGKIYQPSCVPNRGAPHDPPGLVLRPSALSDTSAHLEPTMRAGDVDEAASSVPDANDNEIISSKKKEVVGLGLSCGLRRPVPAQPTVQPGQMGQLSRNATTHEPG